MEIPSSDWVNQVGRDSYNGTSYSIWEESRNTLDEYIHLNTIPIYRQAGKHRDQIDQVLELICIWKKINNIKNDIEAFKNPPKLIEKRKNEFVPTNKFVFSSDSEDESELDSYIEDLIFGFDEDDYEDDSDNDETSEETAKTIYTEDMTQDEIKELKLIRKKEREKNKKIKEKEIEEERKKKEQIYISTINDDYIRNIAIPNLEDVCIKSKYYFSLYREYPCHWDIKYGVETLENEILHVPSKYHLGLKKFITHSFLKDLISKNKNINLDNITKLVSIDDDTRNEKFKEYKKESISIMKDFEKEYNELTNPVSKEDKCDDLLSGGEGEGDVEITKEKSEQSDDKEKDVIDACDKKEDGQEHDQEYKKLFESFKKLKVSELKGKLKDLGCKGYSNLKKDLLIAKLIKKMKT